MIGISTFKAFPELPALGISNGIELELNKLIEPIRYGPEFLAEIIGSKYYGHYQSAHGPFFDLMPPSKDEELRDLCLRKFQRAIAACEALGIKNVIFHNGWIKGYYGDAEWIRNSAAFWTALMDSCSGGVRVHLENVAEPSPRLIKDVVAAVDRPDFKACLDIGHVNLLPDPDIELWIDELGDMIGHLHIHNNYGKEDSHNGLDQGSIDMERTLSVIAEKCPQANWNLEIRTNFQASIDMIKRFAPPAAAAK